MIQKEIFILCLLVIKLNACAQKSNKTKLKSNYSTQNTPEQVQINIGKTIKDRFELPIGYERISYPNNSYAEFLRNLPLKENGALVELYDGRLKPNWNIYAAVVDLPIGKKNLHQCADAVIRLRAEYLWEAKRYDDIHFNLTNGFRVDYSEWMKGKRVAVEGNKTYWVQRKKTSNTYDDLWNYLEFIFTYAGTLSLSKELITVPIENIKIGDIFIQGGSPGHAVFIVDMAKNTKTGDKIFMIAQSYMPAQQIQILNNNNNSKLSPWYYSKIESDLRTPEWKFKRTDLKRFK
jgi:hypothetical protein